MEQTTKSLADTEIAALPPWAQVALAARCARRLYPLLNVRLDEQGVLANAIDQAGQSARGGGTNVPVQTISSAATAADKTIVRGNEALLAASYAARAACCAIQAAASILGANPAKTAAVKYATEAFGSALRAVGAERVAQLAILRDLKAARAAIERAPHHDAISQELFGPLWPEGLPDGWPADASAE